MQAPTANALSWLHDLGESGITRPQIFSCDDRVERVLKIPGLGAGSGPALASDWVGSLLAVELGVMAPAPRLVWVSEEAIQTAPPHVRSMVKPSWAYGCEYVRRAQTVHGLGAVVECVNHAELISRLAVLDTWIGTEDRMRPDFGRNLLVNAEGKALQLMAIDFGMAFTPVLFRLVGTPPTEQAIQAVCHPVVRHLVLGEVLMDAIWRVEQTTEDFLRDLIATTPAEWLDHPKQAELVEYLMRRQARLRTELLSQLGVQGE